MWVNLTRICLFFTTQRTSLFGGKKEKAKISLGCHDKYILMNGFDVVNDVPEHIRIFHDEVCKDFAINFDMRIFQLIDEGAIRKTSQFNGFGNSGNPETPEIPFLIFPTGECVFACMEIRFFGNPNQAAFRHPIAFVCQEYFFMFCVTGNASFDPHIMCSGTV